MVRALTSHQCDPGSIPGPDIICGLSLCWFSTLLRVFSGVSGFPPSAKTDTQLIQADCWLCSKVMHGPYSGCQRRLHMLSVRPCRAASLLYFAWAISETVITIITIIVIIIIVIIIIIIIIIITFQPEFPESFGKWKTPPVYGHPVRAVYNRVSENQNQSNYSDQSQQIQTTTSQSELEAKARN